MVACVMIGTHRYGSRSAPLTRGSPPRHLAGVTIMITITAVAFTVRLTLTGVLFTVFTALLTRTPQIHPPWRKHQIITHLHHPESPTAHRRAAHQRRPHRPQELDRRVCRRPAEVREAGHPAERCSEQFLLLRVHAQREGKAASAAAAAAGVRAEGRRQRD